MARNSIGKNLILTSFGESHGPGIGAVLDGFPSNFPIDFEALAAEMNRRRPGQNPLTTPRSEADSVKFLSGIFQGKTLGSPIAVFIENQDTKPEDYAPLSEVYRPGHADLLYQIKYGHRDHRGGGRSSARITAGWVACGALAKQWLSARKIDIRSWVQQIQTVSAPSYPNETQSIPSFESIESSWVRCPDPSASQAMINRIKEAQEQGDSLGGKIATAIVGLPAGIGEPVFGKLQSVLAQYLFSLNAVKALGFGEGESAATMKGSEHNDPWLPDGKTASNHSGGIIGGISSSEIVHFSLTFKPTSSIQIPQQTINHNNQAVEVSVTGRHDPCVLPRAVPIVEALSALAIMDLLLESPSQYTF
jgi:chorismate synthase